jgi:uncharacterized membrane protein
MPPLSLPDLAALGFFAFAWLSYHMAIERRIGDEPGLNHMMNDYRRRWMEEMAERDSRIVDSGIMASLQNGTAFFASTSLIAIGGVATLLRTTDDVLRIFSEVSVGLVPDRSLWEIKVIGLLLMFGYAFFKFAWAYRLFNYTAILIGATPPRTFPDRAERDRMVKRAGAMNIVAGSHFTRGQRAFFFALAYLGWFLGPWTFMASTGAVLYVMGKRQFGSDARRALQLPDDPA